MSTNTIISQPHVGFLGNTSKTALDIFDRLNVSAIYRSYDSCAEITPREVVLGMKIMLGEPLLELLVSDYGEPLNYLTITLKRSDTNDVFLPLVMSLSKPQSWPTFFHCTYGNWSIENPVELRKAIIDYLCSEVAGKQALFLLHDGKEPITLAQGSQMPGIIINTDDLEKFAPRGMIPVRSFPPQLTLWDKIKQFFQKKRR